jgi:glucose-1-phosphate thymidylyltransferase
MKLIVLAAGYATRLYPLTRDRAKALLPIGDRPIIEHLLDRLAPAEQIDGVYVVTNAKFAGSFEDWAEVYAPPRPGLRPRVLDDGTTDDATRLGAIGDLQFALEREGVGEDVVVSAGDSFFTDSVAPLAAYGTEIKAPVQSVYDVGDVELVKRYSAVTVDDEGRITHLEEKPEHPETTLAGVALYFYPAVALPLVGRYLAEGNNPDQPGRLVEWLYTRTPVYVWRIPGRWVDIGSHETLREADEVLAQT